jgi:hypothetical protein
MVSDAKSALKTPFFAIFTPKNASKNAHFAPFFVKKHQKMHFFHLKNALKTLLFANKTPKVHHLWYVIFFEATPVTPAAA